MTNDQLAADVAELKRQMKVIIDYAHPKRVRGDFLFHRDLTTPPPKPRPVIEAKYEYQFWRVRCGSYMWYGTQWAIGPRGLSFSEHDARAIAAALEAAGNYPGECKEEAR